MQTGFGQLLVGEYRKETAPLSHHTVVWKAANLALRIITGLLSWLEAGPEGAHT